MLVVGCKGLGSGDEDVESVKKYDKVWTKENSSENDYLRFFDQFGTSKNVKTATVELKVGNAKNSKAGLVFSLNENDNKTVSFYVLGVGRNYATGTPEYYLDYYSALDPKALSQTTTGETLGTAKPEEIVKLTSVSEKDVTVDGDAVSVIVKIDVTDPKAISVKFGPKADKMNVEIPTFEHKNLTATDALGGIGAYGMLRPSSTAGQIVKTVNNYTVIESDPNKTLLAAEDAE
ncbi:MAG: hypothetical protein J6R67_03835 [Treponema sp.]|nr:hypothetical protein [Treponema sp.]